MLSVVRRSRCASDEGSITVLIIGYTALAMVLIIVGVDVSKVFLAQRALASAADAAALAGSEGVDRAAIYNGAGLGCGDRLPLDGGRAERLAAAAFDGSRADLAHTFASLGDPQTAVVGGDVGVTLTGNVAVPFGRVLSWLDPSRPNGLVSVTETAHADSPVAGVGCAP